MWETAKFTAGDATRLKFWKILLLEFVSAVDFSISVIGQPTDSTGFPPLTTGTVPTTNFLTAATTNVLKRLKFLIRTPVLSIRAYPATAITSGTVTTQRFKLFWYSVGGKLMRQGRAS